MLLRAGYILMLRFLYPELFLLAIPLWLAYRRWGCAPGMTGALRVAILALLLTALAGPRWNLGGQGLDVIVVADRSRSLMPQSEERIRELIRNLQASRRKGDRIGLVTFGAVPAVESMLSAEALLQEYQKQILPDGSDLNEALHTALNLVDPRRPARILVLSDGEANGAAPTSAARRARDLGVPIDYREFPRVRVGDVAVDSLLLPESVSPREPFQYTVWVHTDRESAGRVSIYRNGERIVQDENDRLFSVGMNRLQFRDILEEGGLHNYEVRLETEGDPLIENNRGAGVVRVDAGPRLLVLNADGRDDNFVRALRAGQIPVAVGASKGFTLSPDSLDGFRAVVLENVPAADFGRSKLERLAQFVEDLGGGLMLTGGERSFGTGGYFKSPLDETLPVSMEMREEHRKTKIALVIALDRSGSMAVPVKGNKLKMDLANLGTAEAIRMLSPGDSVAVIAVDSAPHTVQPLNPVENTDAIVSRVLRIQSEGGGIFVYEALVAAGKELLRAEQTTKHIILFSDAADSEEPGDYRNLLAQFEKSGITVSVIGLGRPTDTDARLLEGIAKLGRGNILFTDDAEELPRLFTQDTMSVARSSFVKKDAMTQPSGIPGRIETSARLMGEYARGTFPTVDGYNLSYLKPDATLGVVSEDEYQAPWSAFWYRGLGRVAAITLEVDGQYSGAFGRWDEYADFAVTHARWLLGGDNADDVFVRLEREGQEAVVTIELDPDRPAKRSGDAPTLSVLNPSEFREQPVDLPFQWTGAHTLEARFRLLRAGTYRTLVKLGRRNIVRGPAVTLPYSPEYMPRTGLPSGRAVLEAVSQLTGGRERVDVPAILTDPPRSVQMLPLLPWLLMVIVALLILEIAGRRLALWTGLREFAPALVPKRSVRPAEPETSPWRRPWEGLIRAKSRAESQSARTTPAAAPVSSAEPEAKQPPADAPASDIFAQAKRRAKRRRCE